MSIKYIISLIALVAMIGGVVGQNVVTLGNDIQYSGGNIQLLKENNDYAQGLVDQDTMAAVILMVPIGALMFQNSSVTASELNGWVWATVEDKGRVLLSVTNQKNVVMVVGATDYLTIETAKRVGDI